MTLPDFFVIGAARSGTTGLWANLRRHPGIYLSDVKEARFFLYDPASPSFEEFRAVDGPWEHDLAAYEALFAAAPSGARVGDISPQYLTVAGTAERIAARVPDARIVAVLRHPLDRAYSHWALRARLGEEPLRSFAAALADEPRRSAEGQFPSALYLSSSEYGRLLRPYLDAFPREHVHVVLHERLRAEPTTVLNEITDFVGASPTFRPEDAVVERNGSHFSRSTWLERVSLAVGPRLERVLPERAYEPLRAAFHRSNTTPVPPLDPALRERYAPFVEEQVAELDELLGLDAGLWLAREAGQVAA